MRVAVIGAGISGLACAWRLRQTHDVTVFEASNHAGGHAHTVEVEVASGRYNVDTGFIVFNRGDYPVFSALLDELGVATRPTTMSFSVHDERTRREYCATENLGRLFAQRSNLLRPDFYRMLRDITRFYRTAPALLQSPPPGPALYDFLESEAYSSVFREFHLFPMASALWSAPIARVGEFPARSLVSFMERHSMLRLTGRPQWLTIDGGSSCYVARLMESLGSRVALGTPVRRLSRQGGPRVFTDAGEADFDAIVVACHPDQALALLDDSSEQERSILGAIRYQANDVVLHTDESLLPERRRAWASWNYRLPGKPRELPLVTYHMNTLQSLDAPEQICVTLNGTDRISSERVLERFRYDHPQFDHAAIQAQERLESIQGRRHTWYCGAWTGHGFHEDGAASGMRVAREVARA